MPPLERPDPVIMGHLLAQHRELHAQVLAVRAALAEPQEPDGGRLARLRESLRSLREHLHDHFDREERGGFMEESQTRMPRLSAAVRRVLAEHPRLLGELDRLLDGLGMGDISAVAWHAAGRDFEAFAAHLLAHERDENAVVQEGYNEDLGLVD